MQTGNLGEDAIFVSFAPFAIGLGLDAEALRDLILRLGKDVHKLLVNGFDLFRGELGHPHIVPQGNGGGQGTNPPLRTTANLTAQEDDHAI